MSICRNALPEALLLSAALLYSYSCATPHIAGSFRVLPSTPDYLLRAPDFKEIPFPEVLKQHTNTGPAWVELRPRMQLRIEQAYFREGTKERNLANYLGTEIVRYSAGSNGVLRQISLQSGVTERPTSQPPVQRLLRSRQNRYRLHRYFYQVLVNRQTGKQNAILLSAASTERLDRLTRQLLSNPDSVCDRDSVHCTVFPEACSVALEMEIVVNGAPRTALWGSAVASVAQRPQYLELIRLYEGRPSPVEMDSTDPNALRLPLLPGDRVTWR